MPAYDYKCTECGSLTEVRHPIAESAVGNPCPVRDCPGTLRKAFVAAPPMYLDGTGWTKKPAPK